MGNMKDKIDAIIKGDLKPKFSYYLSPSYIKISIIILIIIVGLAIDCIFE